MKRLLLMILASVCIAVPNARVQECGCSDYKPPICAVFGRADAVFAGQLVDIKQLESKTEDVPLARLQFLVEQPYRGVSGGHVDVLTHWGDMCRLELQKGKRYLVYASLDEDGKQLGTELCSGTKPLKDAEGDLAYIRSVMRGDAGESISGRLSKNLAAFKSEGVPAVRVEVEGNGKTFETTTDENGRFSVSLPGPGTFKVRGFVPFGASLGRYDDDKLKSTATDHLTTFEYEVMLEKNQCHYEELPVMNIDVHATATVSGRVLDSAGLPVNKGWVYLIDVADPNHSHLNHLNEDGAFKFASIPAGEYYLVLNPRNEPPHEDNPPYPRTYFPSASEPAEATKIVVTEGAKVEDVTLRVGPPFKENRVAGTVVWQDGRALKDAYVVVYAGKSYFRRIDLGKKPKFDFVLYGDFDYSIEAGDDRGEIEGESERVKLTPANATSLKLSLRRVAH